MLPAVLNPVRNLPHREPARTITRQHVVRQVKVSHVRHTGHARSLRKLLEIAHHVFFLGCRRTTPCPPPRLGPGPGAGALRRGAGRLAGGLVSPFSTCCNATIFLPCRVFVAAACVMSCSCSPICFSCVPCAVCKLVMSPCAVDSAPCNCCTS